MNYPLVIVKFRDVIQDSSWDGPDKVNCPVVKSEALPWRISLEFSITLPT